MNCVWRLLGAVQEANHPHVGLANPPGGQSISGAFVDLLWLQLSCPQLQQLRIVQALPLYSSEMLDKYRLVESERQRRRHVARNLESETAFDSRLGTLRNHRHGAQLRASANNRIPKGRAPSNKRV